MHTLQFRTQNIFDQDRISLPPQDLLPSTALKCLHHILYTANANLPCLLQACLCEQISSHAHKQEKQIHAWQCADTIVKVASRMRSERRCCQRITSSSARSQHGHQSFLETMHRIPDPILSCGREEVDIFGDLDAVLLAVCYWVCTIAAAQLGFRTIAIEVASFYR